MIPFFTRTLEPRPVEEEPTLGHWLVAILGLLSAILIMYLWGQVSIALVAGDFDISPRQDLLLYSPFVVLILVYVAVLQGGSWLLGGRGSFGQTFRGIGRSLLWPSFLMLPTMLLVELTVTSSVPWRLGSLLIYWSLATWTYCRIVLVLEEVHEIQRWRVALVAIVPFVLVASGG